MVVKVTLSGGLGNQLFIQVAGMWLSGKTGEALQSHFGENKHEFTLHGNRIEIGPTESRSSHESILGLIRSKAVQYEELLKFVTPKGSRVLFASLREFVAAGPGYDPAMTNLSGKVCLHGYFQTWRFAQEVDKGEIRKLIPLPTDSNEFDGLAKKAKSVSPAIIHIRRGDYKKLSRDFGLLSKDYYAQALKRLEASLSSETPIWIFTDEPGALVQDFKDILPANAAWISGQYGLTAAQELCLMSYGSAHIISNSTFAWWGAWLSESKIVIRPEKWFRGRDDPQDLCPQDWIALPSQWDDSL